MPFTSEDRAYVAEILARQETAARDALNDLNELYRTGLLGYSTSLYKIIAVNPCKEVEKKFKKDHLPEWL